MYRRVFAFDFDSTLAENGIVPPALQTALEHLRTAGYALFLVTGRRFESLALGPLGDVFTGIVWENGAVLYHTATREVYQPFGQIAPRLVEALKAAGVPLEYGRAIVSTRIPHDETVWHILSEWGGDAAVVHNKGAVMILPPGTAKGAGLVRLLEMCGFSPRNLVSFGDGENDLSLLHMSELGVAVADAVPTLREVADLVTRRPGPAGVLEVLEAYWLSGSRHKALSAAKPERLIPLGEDGVGASVFLPGATLASGNLGVFGDPGTGKSWAAGLLAEGMHHAGYQILLIDPEGDFRGMRVLPEIVALEGTQRTIPSPALVAEMLETVTTVSVVLDLSSYPITLRDRYMADLLNALRSLKERMFRPHWILVEEAQHFLPLHGNAVSRALLPMLADGGWAFVSYRPDRLAGPVLAALNQCIITRLCEPEPAQTLYRTFSLPASPADIPAGHAWLCNQGLVHLRPSARQVPHMRHRYKYLDSPLPQHKRFYFHDRQGFLGLEAASLFEFLQSLPEVPIESLNYHQARGDFAAWASGALGDDTLAAHLHNLAHRLLEDEALREALVQYVAIHYAELHAQH
ncbi:MAG: HAD hydrolase family protein [Chloroflexi bacterium]|nr:HAD hydrolase family protein [Chloroflexota bacterium]